MTVSLRQKRQSEFFSLWQFIYDISVSYEQAANYEIFVVYARNEYRAFYMTYCQEKMTTSVMIDTKFSRDPPCFNTWETKNDANCRWKPSCFDIVYQWKGDRYGCDLNKYVYVRKNDTQRAEKEPGGSRVKA